MPQFHRLIPVLLLWTTAAAATGAGEQTAGPVAELHAFLSAVHSLKASFTQTVLDPDMKTVKQSAGTVLIKRPNRFRWDYTSPFTEVIDSDGSRIWIYDVQLQQVTVKPLDQTLASSPAVLLAGSNDIGDNFDIEPLDTGKKLSWVKLTPKVKDTDFKYVRLGLSGDAVAVMELVDTLGQTTRIEFHDLIRNPAISDSRFHFTPPAGADVIGDAGSGA